METVGLWQDVQELPEALSRTIDGSIGFDDAARMLAAPQVRRVVATGNGAAYYVAQALWLASLSSRSSGPDVVSVPSGLVAQGRFPWRPGDVLLAISSSGEFRDLVEATDSGASGPYVSITAAAESTVGAAADVRALFAVVNQRAVTHTQVFCGGVTAALSVWARVCGDAELLRAIGSLPALAAEAVAAAETWVRSGALDGLGHPRSAVAFGSGPAWPAALETALLLKEVAGVPAEGAETREGATSCAYPLGGDDLVVSLQTGQPDPLLAEAEALCRATGATVVQTPGPAQAYDSRLAPVLTLPFAVSVAIRLAQDAGLDVDRPSWVKNYFATARSAGSKPGSA